MEFKESPYRGIRMDGKGWIYGLLFIGQSEYYNIIKYPRKKNEHTPSTPVKSDTVGEFLGLYDMLGTPIYDGDILDFDEDEWGGEFEPEVFTKEKVIGKWELHGTLSDTQFYRKIIGNIYEKTTNITSNS